MDEILHRLRNPGMMFPCKYQHTMVFNTTFKVLQDLSLGEINWLVDSTMLTKHYSKSDSSPLNPGG